LLCWFGVLLLSRLMCMSPPRPLIFLYTPSPIQYAFPTLISYPRIARPTPVHDTPPAPGSHEAAALSALAADVDTMAATWLDSLRRSTPPNRQARLAEWLAEAGTRPPLTQPEALSFYYASLLFPDTRLKIRLVQMTRTEERLREIKALLEAGARGGPGGECAIM
jgi:hypothetical protein